MHTKLHINISQGVVDVEGDPELVREVYADFRDRLLAEVSTSSRLAAAEEQIEVPPAKSKPKRRARKRERVASKESTSGMSFDSPKMDKNLNTSGLEDYFAKFEPKNNPEKILIYLKFIVDELSISPPNSDQVFTCFRETDQKIPEAFPQAFYNASNRHGFIEFKSAENISITVAGENHFNLKLKRKPAE